MAMGKRKQRQESLFITVENLPRSDGHPFYRQLNALLAEAEFDRWVEARCRPFYEQEETYVPQVIRCIFPGFSEACQAGHQWP